MAKYHRPDAINGRVVEHVAINDLKPYSNHARRHSKEQIKKLKRSIREFDFVLPILIDENNIIVAGHGLVEAAKLLGLREVPVLRTETMPEAKKRALRLALNRLAEDAEWDRERLALEFEALIELDINLDITGFDGAEIDLALEELRVQSTDPAGPEDDVPSARTDEPAITKPGDFWILGNHRLLCGDARDATAYQVVMDGQRARMAFTDPPYNARVADIGNRGRIKHGEFAFASSEMTRPQYTRFLAAAFRQMADVSVDGAVHFICTDAKHLGEMTAATEDTYDQHLTLVVWDKEVGGMGGLYRNQHELIFVEKVGKAPILNNVELGRHGRNRTNMWRYRGLASFGKDRLETLASHPTVKPVTLVADAILDVSKRRDIVLDSFAGSGTTIIAAEKTGRLARVIEIDPHYCDVIVRRWQKYAGRTAVHAGSGLAFDDIAEKRLGEAAVLLPDGAVGPANG